MVKSRSLKAGRGTAENTQAFQEGRMPALNREAKTERIATQLHKMKAIETFQI